VDLVHIDKGHPAHIARHDVAKLEKGVSPPHAEGGIPTQLANLAAQFLDFAIEAKSFTHHFLQHGLSRFHLAYSKV
jgi:hypothetical protein